MHNNNAIYIHIEEMVQCRSSIRQQHQHQQNLFLK